MLPSKEIQELKSSLSITAVAKKLGINVVRNQFRCLFPERHAHGDRSPSVSINEEKGYFKCFVCEEVKGDVISLVRLALGISFLEAVKWLRGGEMPKMQKKQKIKQQPSQTQPQPPPFFKEKIILDFLNLLSPIPPRSLVAWWLAKRHIFKPVWDKVLLRVIEDHKHISRKLLEKHSLKDLQSAGLFNKFGQMKYEKHPLIIPYIDEMKRPFFFQARAINKEVTPKELNSKGPIPFPFNKAALDGKHGTVYLCEGAIDTLTLLGHGFSAVGIPGAKSFKPEWVEMFKNKKTILCLDNDAAGKAGEKRISALLKEAGLETESFWFLPEGEDINSWFTRAP
jgi:DNA primase